MSIQTEYSSYIGTIFHKSDDNVSILSNEFQESEMDIIYDFIKKMYSHLIDEINQPHFLKHDDGTSTKATEIEIRDYYNKRIEAILKDKEIVEEWYKNNNIHLPGTAEAIKHNKMKDEILKTTLTKIIKRKEKEAKTELPILRAKDADAILKKMEKDNYIPTKDDVIIKHRSFKKYTTRYTKDWKVPFPIAVQHLIKNGSISLKDFHSLCKSPNSDFIKNHLVESFKYECTNPGGNFYGNKKLRTLKVLLRRINGTKEREPVFIL